MKILKKALLSLIVLFSLLKTEVRSQITHTFSYEKKYKLREAYTFENKDHGISAENNTEWNKITVQVKTKKAYTLNLSDGSERIVLYEAFILPEDANSGLKHHGNSGLYNYLPFNSLTSHQYEANRDTRDFYHFQAYAVDTKVPSSGWAKWGDDDLDVIVTISIEGDSGNIQDIQEIKVPGISKIISTDLGGSTLIELRNILENPQAYPNYVMLAAHRGYWMYAPENSLEAFQNAIDIGADIVEIDLKMTADGHVMIAHDFHLGRLTDVPEKLKDGVFQKQGTGHYLISKMRFCDLRPDLCPGGSDYNKDSPNNCDTCTATEGIGNNLPVKLIRPNGVAAEKMPTLEESFDFFLQQFRVVLIDLDKIDPGAGTLSEPKTYFFDEIYRVAQEKNILDRIIVKQRIDKFSPEELKASLVVDWKKWYFTPTVFSDNKTDDCGGSLMNCLDGYFTDPEINSPGVEYVYMEENDPVFDDAYYHIKSVRNNRIFQFPAYPENEAGVWNPKPFEFSDIDASEDRRNDWNWLLQTKRRPDVIISDRFEVLYDLLNLMGLRQK